MLSRRGDVLCYLIVALLFLSDFCLAGDDKNRSRLCDTHNANPQCGKNQRCHQRTKDEIPHCDCVQGYELVMGECIQSPTTVPSDTTTVKADSQTGSGGSSVAAGLLIPTFLIIVGVLLYFGARRYKWLQRFRQFRQNRYGNVLVTRNEDDDDDPPIA